ncbi:hypothetical protein H0H92_013177 [Tricholoma furcatifolium]|nr:hypothetical protein H0H92_013177 [Tricholoma furcatifolium]
MAYIDRIPKPGREWTQEDLQAYKISVREMQLHPDSTLHLDIDPAILNCPLGHVSSTTSDVAAIYLGYLYHAINPSSSQKFMRNQFLKETLKLMRFDNEPRTLIKSQHPIPFTVRGRSLLAETDLCLIHTPSSIILLPLIEDDESTNFGSNADAVVIAQALAAFAFNNAMRFVYRLAHLPIMIIPCILINGTRPTFYLVPITEELSTAVVAGKYPMTPTEVWRYHIPVTDDMLPEVDLKDVKYRQLAFRCLLMFKTTASEYWKNVMEGVPVKDVNYGMKD